MTVFVSDGFDYGSYNGWTTEISSGTLAVNSASAYQSSNYGLSSSTTGINSYAAILHSITGTPIAYHRAYYKLNGMPSSGGLARIVLGGIYDSGYSNAVNPCIRNIGGNLYWELAVVINGSITFTTESTASNPTANTWYSIEVLRDLTNQTATLWVNGTQKVNVTGLSQVNNSVSVEVGLDACDYSTPGSTTCYVDAVVAGNAYNGTTTYNLTIQQGTGGTTNPTNGVYTESYSGKQETITAMANSGYTFSYWNVDGSNAGSTNPYTITMSGNHTIQPVFTSGGSSDLTVTGNLTVNGTTTLNNKLDVSGMINSHASGSSPIAGSNAGMILDCYTPTHQDGLGIQSGGIWLKYDNNFNIYYDNGSTILTAVALDTTGSMSIAGTYSSRTSGSYPGPHTNAGMILDAYTPSHSDGLGIQAGGLWIKYGTNFDIYNDSGTAITDTLHLDSSGNMTLLGIATLYTSSIAPVSPNPTVTVQSQFKVAPGYYTYVDYLAPSTQNNTAVTVESNLKVTGAGGIIFPIYNGTQLESTSIIAVLGAMDPTKPLIQIEYGLTVGGDIAAYGQLGCSTSPNSPTHTGGGAILIGHGHTDVYDPPRITLTDTANHYSPANQYGGFVNSKDSTGGYYEYDTLYITKSNLWPDDPNVNSGQTDAAIFNTNGHINYITNWELGNLAAGSIRHPFIAGSGGVTTGALVSLDSSGNVVLASSSNSSAVIGVATSTQSQGNVVNVIIWGLARVAVAQTINPGQLISVSSTPGYAQPYNGTTTTGRVIGKAISQTVTQTPPNPPYVDLIISISS
jgi:hypothetical protein